ncbi:unnamed protein product [Periconia digitata]|uniref:Uncharacterized protein n=1 Tax=Periconia digitata TaxID=1303443 RepID=A0A9W4UNU8_9PLEO|nr:unnamed protein product [Periconia digitata]
MTLRSPKQQPPKSTTTARKIRNRADQGLAIHPPEVRQYKGQQAFRANTIPGVHQIHRSQNIHTGSWEPENSPSITRSSTSHPSGFEQDPHSSALIAQPLGSTQYISPRESRLAVSSGSAATNITDYTVRATPESDLLQSPLPSLSGSHTATEFDLRISAEPEPSHDAYLRTQDMSAQIGYMMAPAPYAMDYGSPHHLDSPTYPPIESPYPDTKQTSSAPYPPSYAHSHSVSSHNTSRRSVDQPSLPPYQAPSMPRSPYQQSMAPVRTSASPMSYPMTTSEAPSLLSSAPQQYTYPAMHSNVPAQSLGSSSGSYPPPPLYPSTSYADYAPFPGSLHPTSSSPGHYSPYEQHTPTLGPSTTSPVTGLSSAQPTQPSGVMPRILNSRPKPQCWEHGCNGRQFSTFSNLLRHQREKSGTATKSTCPRCGAEFTRTTARNGHMAHEKCKPRRTSDSHR